jgi:hypothetical protein
MIIEYGKYGKNTIAEIAGYGKVESIKKKLIGTIKGVVG